MTNQQVLDTEQELLRLRAEYDNFVYHTTHDLAALFRHINVFATEVSDQLTKQDDIFFKEHVDIHKFAELISTTSKNGSTIIRALQDYDELDKTPPNLTTIDLNSLVTDAISNLNSVEGLSDVKMVYQDLPTIVSDRKLLLKVFQEIFKNSIMYRDPKSTCYVTISVVSDKDNWVFKFTDNGLGIKLGIEERIFNILTRADNSNKYRGLGMGLAIIRRCIAHLGGQTSLEKNQPTGVIIRFNTPKLTS